MFSCSVSIPHTVAVPSRVCLYAYYWRFVKKDDMMKLLKEINSFMS